MAEQDVVETTGSEIAVIGMSGRFPGAPDLRTFWENLRRGVESLTRFPPEALEASPLLPPALRSHPNFVPAGAVLEGADRMDYGFFDFSPREARWMDPQLRVFLECAWAALEDAAYPPEAITGKVALYAGAGASGHVLSVLGHAGLEPATLFEALGTSTGENLAMRVSHELGLRGESMSVYTACSTGLVTVHMACQSLLLRQSDVALAGAVKVATPQRTGYLYQEGMIFSPDGHCRAFDQRARGTVVGNGAGVVVLKRLEDALRDGDHVYAVIRGSALNNDAGAKVGYTAPSVEGQADVIRQALAYAEVSADDIGYVEAHGTGTPLGDPIELAALTRAYREDTSRRGYCAIGSVKTNIGHLDTAAGLAGFIKVALALHHGEVPASLNFERPNPAIDFDGSPFFVNTALRPWPRGATRRRAAVSSFGIGGTNAHAVLEEARVRRSVLARRPLQLVTLSARTASALDTMTRDLAEHLDRHPEAELADVAFTRNAGRRAFEHRRVVLAQDRTELLTGLRAPASGRKVEDVAVAKDRRIAFLFPGQASQSARMGEALYRSEPVFREHVDACAEVLRGELGEDLRQVLYPASGDGAARLSDPRFALPALFAVEHALARLWMAWGLEPVALLGHSFGEYAAACVAGVLPFEDAARLAAARGRLMAGLPPGAMLAVGLSEAEVSPLLSGRLSLAAVNAPDRCVVSGPEEEVARLERELSARGAGVVRLSSRHAFHSADVEPLMAGLTEAMRRLRLAPPRIPYVSSLTGGWITPAEATSPEYWARQMRAPVRFSAGVDALLASSCVTFVEVGPDQGLTALVRPRLRGVEGALVVPSLRRADSSSGSDARVLHRSLGDVWLSGAPVAWDRYHAADPGRIRVPLPAYPFEGKPCALEPRWPTFGAEAPATAARAEARSAAEPVHAEPAAPVPVAADGGGKVAPRNDIERRVAEIWRELLGVEALGIHDDFLELGGNSLMAAQMLTRLREAFPVQLPLSELFEAPTVAGIAARLEALVAAEQGGGAREEPVTRIPREGRLPLSVVQSRVIAIERAHPGTPALNMPLVLRLEGTLDVAALERAMDEVVRRHETLRTLYVDSGGEVQPRVLPSARLSPRTVQVADEATALRLAREEAERPFRIAEEPPVRATVLRLGAQEHWLLLTLHHVVSDTLSLLAFVREVAALYTAFTAGRPSPLPELRAQYVDYAAWQARAYDSAAWEPQRAYWRRQLADPSPPLELPVDHPGAERTGFRSTRCLFCFPPALSEGIRALSQTHGATPFMTVLAGLQALLARYSGRDDILVGTPQGNRSRAELDPLIGYVAQSVALRTDLSGDPSFEELLSRVREVTLAAQANPDIPYEKLLLEARPELADGRSRLFDAMLVLQSAFSVPEMPGLRLGLVEVPETPAQFGATLSHLSFSMGEDARGFHGSLEYTTDLFEPATIERLLGHLQNLLAAGVARPTERLSALPLLGEDERRRLLVEWSGRAAQRRREVDPIGGLRARLTGAPDAVALEVEGRTLTMGEVAAQVGGLARGLRADGVGRGSVVGIAFPPSAERVLCMLAVLEAGCAYALLGRGDEVEGLARVLAPASLREAFWGAPVFCPYFDGGPRATLSTEPAAGPGALLCLGSSAMGARALLSRRNAARVFAALDEAVPATPGGAWLAVGEGVEALAGLELLWALSRGLRLVFPPEAPVARLQALGAASSRRLDFSLSYFANDEDQVSGAKYRLLLDGARFADRNGFTAIWTPERHFHSFGGLYPSPAVVSAGLATATERVRIRAGSVVLPLHDPIVVAEQWAVVDNLSGGRVDVSFASGWHANDFALAPDVYARRKQVMLERIQQVRGLWRGEPVRRRDGNGAEVDIRIRPRPVQRELPFWLTAAGNRETFRLAGELGANLLTNLMGQTLEDLAGRLAVYRQAWAAAGHPGRGRVTLMMHAFLAADPAVARARVREPLMRYFRSSVDIFASFAATQGLRVKVEDLTEKDIQSLVEHGFDRYVESAGLFGSPESCGPMVERLREMDVDEVACLVDFGTEPQATLDSLAQLAVLRERSDRNTITLDARAEEAPGTLVALARERGVTHLGCAAAVARALFGATGASALSGVGIVTGGLAEPLEEQGQRLIAVERLERVLAAGLTRAEGAGPDPAVPPPGVERYVVDESGQPVPAGVAGQLVLGGDAAPLGFWRDARAESARWVVAPFAEGGRLLATGERARFLADGRLERLGRFVPKEAPRKPAAPAALPAPVTAPRPRAEARAIPRAPREGELPLSYSQQQMWMLERLSPGNLAYNNLVALRLTGPLNVDALERAINEVVRRHEVLRTCFPVRDGVPSQRILPELRLSLAREELTGSPEAEREPEALLRVREEGRRPFDLERGPLIRATLLRLGAQSHLLVMSLHHIVSDGWSSGVLSQELALLYGVSPGDASPLPSLPIQYADYAAWQRNWPRETLEAQLSYWTGKLAGLPELRLPLDHPRRRERRYQGARHPVVIPAEVARALAAVGRREGATPFMVLAAGFQALLSRYTGQEDFGLGTATAGRVRAELEPLVGCFVNTLVLRADLSGAPTFLELLRRTRQDALGAFAHQELPFERLVDALGVERDLRVPAVIQSMFVLHNVPMPRVSLGELSLSGVEVDVGTAKLDLTLELRQVESGGLEGTLEYDTDLFEPDTAARMVTHLVRLLAEVAAAPERRVRDLALLSDDERRQLLVDWSGERAEKPAACVHQMFEAWAARAPDAVALRHVERSVTYAELNARANRLAARLLSDGLEPEGTVAIFTRDPAERVAAFLGVLKAGGAYLPLDPALPKERLGWMLSDARVSRVLADDPLSAELPPASRRILRLREDAAEQRFSSEDPRLDIPLDRLAYILFTSGSTGRPKGVLVPHGGISNLVAQEAETWEVGPGATLPQLSAPGFDVAVWEMALALASGATLLLPPSDAVRAGPELLRLLEAGGVTTVVMVPTALATLPPAALPALRVLVSGAEVLPPELVDRWAPGRTMFNAYGPTEASVYATITGCHAGEGRPPLGRPVANTEAYVLDARLQPVPVGVPGELFLGGAGLARGYASRPELTAERFVPHPFSRDPGARLYRTGDRARWLPDGRLDFLGRVDEQVKLRGFRIEPGEIEAVLRLHPEVEQAVVVVREDVPGVRQLVAYVVPSGYPAPASATLRAFARDRLPEAMVPSAFVPLKTLPTLPSGKLDRRALPAPERSAASGDANAPLTPVEETLARIWKDVLRVEQVRREDQFFELGGDSILALQVVARANQAGLGLSARDVFRSPTLVGLAEVAGAAPPPAEQGPVTGPVPLTPIQRWFFERALEGAHHWNQSVLLELKEPLALEPLSVALAKLLEHHDALRLRYRRGPAGWEQHGAPPGEQVSLSRVDLSALPDAEVPLALERHTTGLQGSLGLEEGPLMRVALFDLGPGRSGRLFITIHHLAVDGVSWRILLEDLLAAYAQAVRGGVPGLPPKTTSFRSWAERLSGFARSAELESERAYWLAQPWTRAGRLPRELDGGGNLAGGARSTRVSLSLEESRALSEKVSRQHRAGLDEALLAALARVTREWVGGALLVDMEGHGREDVLEGVDVSRTVGWFTSSYPVLLELPQGAGATEALRATREVLRRVPRRGLGFGLLRYLAEPEKAEALARLPRAELSFNYLGRFDSIPSAGRIGLAPERQGADHHPAGARSHLVDIAAQVLGGRLEVVWTYGDVFREATIDALARRHLDALRELVSGTSTEQPVQAKPEDFPLAKVNQKQLDALGKRFGRKKP